MFLVSLTILISLGYALIAGKLLADNIRRLKWTLLGYLILGVSLFKVTDRYTQEQFWMCVDENPSADCLSISVEENLLVCAVAVAFWLILSLVVYLLLRLGRQPGS